MDHATPSRTALRVALRRAAHQLYDGQPLVLDDPIAVPILGKEFLSELHKTNTKLEKPFSSALRAFLVARSRYAEDMLSVAVAQGVTQYVVLGAGLDTFAYRNPHPDLRVFEVDHPATQEWKREQLKTACIPVPATITFVPIDFEKQTLEAGLEHSGLDLNSAAFFSWLGVTPYLTREACMTTLGFIAKMPPSSGVVF